MSETYSEFFCRVTGHTPFPYQLRYASDPFSPTLFIIPTGLGKTDAVLMPWLYAHRAGLAEAPTRLIIVLPRQNLTQQTARNVRNRLLAADLTSKIEVLELMAGSKDNKEDIRPDRPAVIVTTQDIYFSRALNRGYARRPPRWPIDFALYNQDCLIVLDEIQLMDDALATSTQLAAFRDMFGIFGRAPCVWMSATVDPEWLRTVDYATTPPMIRLTDDDLAMPIVVQRLRAKKRVGATPEDCRTPEGCAAFALSRHKAGTRTLVIANTVARAREIVAAVRKKFPSALLLHSRFRPTERRLHAAALEHIPEEGQIVVATQVLEAGVDLTARLLITDLAPWGSLVQRFGRVNRYGEESESEIWWVDRPASSKQKDPTAPYSPEEVELAAMRLAGLKAAAPADLPPEDGPAPWQHVLRRADLIDLFDTSPDLSGNELDVSRFIRATEDKDVWLAWRDWEGDGKPSRSLDELADSELCPVSLGELREFARKHHVYTWNFATEEWDEIGRDRPLYPGMLLVTRRTEGGYTTADGWAPDSKAVVPLCEDLPKHPGEIEGDSSNSGAFQKYRQTLRDHTDRVVQEMVSLLASLRIDPAYTSPLLNAARKHDWGKAHKVFQATMHEHDPSTDLLAKQTGNGRHARPHFRHELASALAMLNTGESDLAAYLAASHHGRVRLSIRSMPGETGSDDVRTVRGICDGDSLPGCELAKGVTVPPVVLSLRVAEFGAEGGSWTERTQRLREALGPFRLAYLEMLLRSADWAASKEPHLEVGTCTH